MILLGSHFLRADFGGIISRGIQVHQRKRRKVRFIVHTTEIGLKKTLDLFSSTFSKMQMYLHQRTRA